MFPLLVKSGEKPAPVASFNKLPNKEGAETGSQALSGQTGGQAVPCGTGTLEEAVILGA